jgi:hypothetical protein
MFKIYKINVHTFPILDHVPGVFSMFVGPNRYLCSVLLCYHLYMTGV